MQTSALGIRLLLWMGKTVPLPAPPEVLGGLIQIEVKNDVEQGDGFQLQLALAKEILDYDLLRSGAVEPFTRVIVGVLMGATPEVLIDGIITHHQVTASDQPGMSVLTLTGKDVSLMMDLEEKNAKYENQPDFVIFSRIIAGYAQYGLVPRPTPTTDIPIMLQRVPRQAETDLAFIRRLAQRNGFLFYLEPVTFGVSTAYFGPEIRGGWPQPALTAGMGSMSNVERFDIAMDSLDPVSAKGKFIEPLLGLSLPIPSLPSLRVPPLVASSAPARRTVLLRDAANENPARAALAGLTAASSAPDAVRLTGTVDGVRYGSVLRARKLVGVRGAGQTHDGIYYVRSVTHRIAPGTYTQQFTLSREGTGALLPMVPP